jgi:site-specific DNA recombinase
MRIIGYARLSRASEESTSIDRQREVLRSYAAARDWDLIETVVDEDVSASRLRLNRPGIARVRQAIARKEADAVLVWRLDRLARSVVDFGLLLDEGVQVVSATEPLDTTSAMGRAMAQVIQVFAELEAKTTALRVRDSRRHLATTGRWPGGQAPYGYATAPRPDGPGRTLVVEETEAATLRRMIDAVLAGSSLYSVLRDLNAEGSRTRRGRTWTLTSTQRLLASPTLRGYATYQGRVVRGDDGLPVSPFPPLVSLDEHAALVELFAPDAAHAASTRAGRLRASRLLSGVVHCQGCGSRLVVRQNTHETRAATYSCPSRSRGVACELRVSARADVLEETVAHDFLAVLGRYQIVEKIEHRGDRGDLAAVVAAIADTTDEMREPDADLPALLGRLTDLQARRSVLESTPEDTWVEEIETDETYAELWAASDDMGRRAMLLDAGVHVVLGPASGARGVWSPDRVELVWGAREDTPDAD